MKSFFLTTIIAVFSFVAFAQTKGNLNGQDGITVSYELSKISGNDKKDKYKIVVTAVNNNDYDLYYAVPLTKQANGKYGLSSFDVISFCNVSSRNAVGLMSFLDGEAKLTGGITTITTQYNEVLFRIGKKETITEAVKFSVKKGEAPVIANSFIAHLQKIEHFDLPINGLFINGNWQSNCGNARFELSFFRNDQGQVIITQTFNGAQQEWVMTSENNFEKATDKTTTLTYNKNGNFFVYSNIDGIVCVWTKK